MTTVYGIGKVVGRSQQENKDWEYKLLLDNGHYIFNTIYND